MADKTIDPHVFVIFGATGDLAQKKLIPALYELIRQAHLEKTCRILGVGSKDIGDDGFRKKTTEALTQAGFSKAEAGAWCSACIHYQPVDLSSAGNAVLSSRIADLEKTYRLPGNRTFYLALPPPLFPDAIRHIGDSGLNRSHGWTRLVVEKPFGRDGATAGDLNRLIFKYFDEPQIFRIDHYLGKETVQNLLVFRFANTIFESLWNRDRIGSVEITAAETIGVEDRARYYDGAGALRDIIQNHLTQLLALVAMEPPALFDPESIRNEKLKVLQSIGPLEPESAVFGQYTTGEIDGHAARSYREEPGVRADSITETYVAIRVRIDNWRWQGVPFFLRTGKRLARRLTRIAVNFRRPPVCMFKSSGGCRIEPNRLVISVQPDEGFRLFFDIKEPGEPLRLRTEDLRFRYAEAFGKLPEAYQTLLRDVLTGDPTLFVRSDEVETSWRLYAPLLEKRSLPSFYQAGSWGPAEADALIVRDGQSWLNT
ncbi:MAG: glucose-6-phosphate dehydrogenase [Acidobacteriota bacterium]|nr:glucose-6-phosphate dehydrogenase [Acidobacteriota bacterium]